MHAERASRVRWQVRLLEGGGGQFRGRVSWAQTDLGIGMVKRGFPGGSEVKNLPANAGGTGSIPGFRRSLGEGNGNTPVFLPRESQENSPWGFKEVTQGSDQTIAITR